MKTKKIPLRKCLGCQERFPKKELIRVVKPKEGDVFLDKTGRANGRGAYICNDKNCLETALKRKAIQRSLETALSEKVERQLLEAISK